MKLLHITLDFLCLILLSLYNYFSEKKLPKNSVIDLLVVNKSKHEMKAYSANSLLKTYSVSFGENPVGNKE